MAHPYPSPAPRPSPDASHVGGRYRIERLLAEGGMGSVYQVIDERGGQTLALKRMHGESSRRVRALFEREYRTLAGLQHPRIIHVLEYGVDATGPYYTMELAQGRDLFELAPLPFKDACRHLRDVATCLALLHTRRLLHRDITPRNVRVLPDGTCKLIDFGALMAFGVPDTIVGTPPCMPPEALRRQPLDQASDIFSLGALLYWTLTRKHAYPAKRIEDLPELWRQPPAPPSLVVPSLPTTIDTLVMRLLNLDPLRRPATVAEVVEHLTKIADLPEEDAVTQRALAESYLAHSEFTGRTVEMSTLHSKLFGLAAGRGSATLVTGTSGVGRSRLLRELIVQAQLGGTRSLHVEAGMHRQSHGVAVAITQQLLDMSRAARREAAAHAGTLAQLDHELAERLGVAAMAPQAAMSGDWRARMQEVLLGLMTAAGEEERLLIAIDDVHEADESSLAMLAGLLPTTERTPIALVATASAEAALPQSRSWQLLRARCEPLDLAPLSAADLLALVRSLFGDAPNVARFSQWLHLHTGGLPLHGLELVHRLQVTGEIRYLNGIWALPAERPAQATAAGLAQLMAQRLEDLSPPAFALAQALAAQRGRLSRSRCMAQAERESDRPFTLLDELVRTRVLEDSAQGYHFAHGVLREAIASRTSDARRRELHLRCAEWELARAHAGEEPMFARIEAGWHLLQAGEESRGADELADAVAFDNVGVRFALADLQEAAPALEAALSVYTKQGRPLIDRLPLLMCLAQAGYYENRIWAERYGASALEAGEKIAGLRLARRLRPWLGRTPSILVALGAAALRFAFTRRRVKTYRFVDVLVQLFGVVTTQTATATIALDIEGARRAAATLEPFAHLPERLTPRGILQFCQVLGEVCRENPAQAMRMLVTLTERFQDPRYYPTLPALARPLYIGGLWFVRGVFEAMRDADGALVAADALDALDLKLYRMIASALRALHYANRGELEHARRHRDLVDLHAIQLGSAWQVELWEPAAMILPYSAMGDIIEMRRVADRLASLGARYPSLQRYARLAEYTLDYTRGLGAGVVDEHDPSHEETLRLIETAEPRSFIGWATVWGNLARHFNLAGDHASARACAERVCSQLTAEDRPFVALFLIAELELALAYAGMGDVAGAKARLDELLVLHGSSSNPLTRGRIHEAFARVSALASDWPTFRHHLEQVRTWYRATGTPALIAQAERLRSLDPVRSEGPARGPTVNDDLRAIPTPVPSVPNDSDPETARLAATSDGASTQDDPTRAVIREAK